MASWHTAVAAHGLAGPASRSGALLARRLHDGGGNAGHGGAARGFGDMAVRVNGEQRMGRRSGGHTSEWSRGRRRLAVDGALRLGRRRHGDFGSLCIAGKGVRHCGEREVSVAADGAGKGGDVVALPAEEWRRGQTERRLDRAVRSGAAVGTVGTFMAHA
jgi:hypothetical protein